MGTTFSVSEGAGSSPLTLIYGYMYFECLEYVWTMCHHKTINDDIFSTFGLHLAILNVYLTNNNIYEA